MRPNGNAVGRCSYLGGVGMVSMLLGRTVDDGVGETNGAFSQCGIGQKTSECGQWINIWSTFNLWVTIEWIAHGSAIRVQLILQAAERVGVVTWKVAGNTKREELVFSLFRVHLSSPLLLTISMSDWRGHPRRWKPWRRCRIWHPLGFPCRSTNERAIRNHRIGIEPFQRHQSAGSHCRYDGTTARMEWWRLIHRSAVWLCLDRDWLWRKQLIRSVINWTRGRYWWDDLRVT